VNRHDGRAPASLSTERAAFVRTDSAVYQLAARQYVRHSPLPFADRCAACRARSCPVRLHAAEVIRAAGVNPASYDPPPRRPAAVHWSRQPTASLPVYGGSGAART
jgi:hypothetical protein